MPRTKVPTKKAPVAKKKPVKKKEVAPLKKKTKKVIVDIIEDEKSPVFDEKNISDNSGKTDDEIYNSLVTEEYEDEGEESEEEEPDVKNSDESLDEIDSQKKFYSDLYSEVKEKNKGEKIEENVHEVKKFKNVSLYRKLVWKFLFATIILLGIVFYFSFSKLTIEITPKGEVLNDSIFFKVSKSNGSEDNTDPRTPLEGTIVESSPILEGTYPATGEQFGNEELIGQVKIINNNNKAQALVATTRLLSQDQKLFRIKSAVNVPAGGEVMVDIYADKPSQEMAIGATTFTIPGLWSGLQDKIFARSDEAFVYDKKVTKYVKQTDLESAAKDINGRLISNATNSQGKNSNWLYSVGDQTKITYSAKAGDLKGEFTAKAQGNIIGISFSKEKALKSINSKLKLLVPDDKELLEFKPEDVVYTLDSYDAATDTATIKATFSGTMALKADATIVSREQLVNLTKVQIDNYLKDFPEIKNYKLEFFPGFVKRAPNLVDRITIKINKD